MSLAGIGRSSGSLLNSRVVIGIVLVAVSIAGGLLMSSESVPSVTVLAVARDVSITETIAEQDLIEVSVAIPAASRDQLIFATQYSEATGRYPLRPLKQGELVHRSALGTGPRSLQEVALSLPPEAPLDPRLVPGDRVDAVATFGKGSADARTVVVARQAEIIDRPAGEDSSSLASQSGQQVVIGTRTSDVLAIVFAMHNGDLALIRSTTQSPDLPAEFGAEQLGVAQLGAEQ